MADSPFNEESHFVLGSLNLLNFPVLHSLFFAVAWLFFFNRNFICSEPGLIVWWNNSNAGIAVLAADVNSKGLVKTKLCGPYQVEIWLTSNPLMKLVWEKPVFTI